MVPWFIGLSKDWDCVTKWGVGLDVDVGVGGLLVLVGESDGVGECSNASLSDASAAGVAGEITSALTRGYANRLMMIKLIANSTPRRRGVRRMLQPGSSSRCEKDSLKLE